MKVLFVLAAACVVVSLVQAELIITEEQKTKLLEHHKVCSGEVSVQDEVIEKLLDGVFSEDQTFKDYLFCLSKRIGFQNAAGEVQKEVIIKTLRNSIEDPTKAEEYTEKCLVEEGNPVDVTYKVVTCLQEVTPKVLFA